MEPQRHPEAGGLEGVFSLGWRGKHHTEMFLYVKLFSQMKNSCLDTELHNWLISMKVDIGWISFEAFTDQQSPSQSVDEVEEHQVHGTHFNDGHFLYAS